MCKDLDTERVGELDTNVVIDAFAVTVTGGAVFELVEFGTEKVEFLTKNPLISGVSKVLGAVATALLMPSALGNKYGVATLAAVSASGSPTTTTDLSPDFSSNIRRCRTWSMSRLTGKRRRRAFAA